MNSSTRSTTMAVRAPSPAMEASARQPCPLRRAARVKHTKPKANPMARDQPMAMHKKMPHRNTADAINISISALSCLTGRTVRRPVSTTILTETLHFVQYHL